MPNLKSCPKCESAKIIPQVRIIDRGTYNMAGNLTVQVCENPDAMLFRYTHDGVLRAWICGDCGYVETYVDNPGELYSAYRESISKAE
jgi:predicted nucleic-acid-binding Zn-ribbon protein